MPRIKRPRIKRIKRMSRLSFNDGTASFEFKFKVELEDGNTSTDWLPWEQMKEPQYQIALWCYLRDYVTTSAANFEYWVPSSLAKAKEAKELCVSLLSFNDDENSFEFEVKELGANPGNTHTYWLTWEEMKEPQHQIALWFYLRDTVTTWAAADFEDLVPSSLINAKKAKAKKAKVKKDKAKAKAKAKTKAEDAQPATAPESEPRPPKRKVPKELEGIKPTANFAAAPGNSVLGKRVSVIRCESHTYPSPGAPPCTQLSPCRFCACRK